MENRNSNFLENLKLFSNFEFPISNFQFLISLIGEHRMKSLFNLKEMMKKAQEMQEQMRKELAETRVEGTSGGGMVTVVLDGTKNLISIKIDPEVVKSGDIDMLQDLIIAAFNDAGVKVDQVMSEKLGSLGAGLKIPGLF